MDIVLDLLLGKLFGHLMMRWPLGRLLVNALAILLGAVFGGLVLGVIAARLWGGASALLAFWTGFAVAGAWFLIGIKEKWGRFRDPTLS
jgi:hypothetical protein